MQPNAAQSIRPVIIGIVITVVMLAGLAYIASARRNAGPAAPVLSILSPRPAARADSPLIVRFTTTAPLSLHPTGWGTGELHLHARLNGVELMPAAADIQQTGDTFAWTMATAPRGSLQVRLGWADVQHRELRSGGSDTISIILQ